MGWTLFGTAFGGEGGRTLFASGLVSGSPDRRSLFRVMPGGALAGMTCIGAGGFEATVRCPFCPVIMPLQGPMAGLPLRVCSARRSG